MVIKNGEWNIILTFLQWSAYKRRESRASKDQKGHTCVAYYMSQQKKKCDWASELTAHGTLIKLACFIQISFHIVVYQVGNDCYL